MFWNNKNFKFWLSNISLGLSIISWIITFSLFICAIAKDSPGNTIPELSPEGQALVILTPLLLGSNFFMIFKMNYVMTINDYINLQDKALSYGVIDLEHRTESTEKAVKTLIAKELAKQKQKEKLAETDKLLKGALKQPEIERGGSNEH